MGYFAFAIQVVTPSHESANDTEQPFCREKYLRREVPEHVELQTRIVEMNVRIAQFQVSGLTCEPARDALRTAGYLRRWLHWQLREFPACCGNSFRFCKSSRPDTA